MSDTIERPQPDDFHPISNLAWNGAQFYTCEKCFSVVLDWKLHLSWHQSDSPSDLIPDHEAAGYPDGWPNPSEEDRYHCDYCGDLGWTVKSYGRVTHKEACPHRQSAWSQTYPGRSIKELDTRFQQSPVGREQEDMP